MIRFDKQTSKVTQIQNTVSKKLDRPGDLPVPDQRLLAELLNKHDFSAELDSAAALPRRDLPTFLFAWIELQKRANDQAPVDKAADSAQNHNHKLDQLEAILLKRSSNTFALQVWTIYQQQIDLVFLNSLLIKMAKACSANRRNRPFINWIKESAEHDDSTTDLVKLLTELTFSKPEQARQFAQSLISLPQAGIYFPRLEYYSEQFLNNSKQFEDKFSLVPVLIYLDILPDSDFLLSFLLEYFKQASDEQIEVNTRLWQYAAQNLSQNYQHQIIQSFYSRFRLEDKWLSLNRTIEKVLENSIVWEKLDNRSQQYFHQWQIVDKINCHIKEQPRKSLFYERYHLQIRQVTDFADEIIIVSFGDYFLADNKTEPDQVWLLDKVLFEMLQEGEHSDILQFEGKRTIPTARELIMNKGNSNLIRLPLDDVNILYAHDLIRQQTNRIRPK